MRMALFGESHGPAVGVVLEGLPAGVALDEAFIRAEMKRRAPGQSDLSTPRKEADEVKILSGVLEGKLTGAPLCAIIENTNTRSGDYEKTKDLLRPGHADYTAYLKYHGFQDYRGGGHFSARHTAATCFAGAVAKLILREKGMEIGAHIKSVAGMEDDRFDWKTVSQADFRSVKEKAFPTISDRKGQKMQAAIRAAKAEGDSVGGEIECMALGVPGGLGSPGLDSVEGVISKYIFAVPAVKGIEFGAGFGFASRKGSEANDSFVLKDGKIETETNHNGGINGGITNGMPVCFTVVVKPTPSIAKPQRTVNIKTRTEEELIITGRHDPCVVHRAVPVIEGAMALALLELYLQGE